MVRHLGEAVRSAAGVKGGWCRHRRINSAPTSPLVTLIHLMKGAYPAQSTFPLWEIASAGEAGR
ncbi:hypothetical protein [Halomonas sp.]|uniref:hypothetical protein n=1 Tax=Halomonas sp. TaxID=1486246 RepID=UPI003A90B6F6